MAIVGHENKELPASDYYDACLLHMASLLDAELMADVLKAQLFPFQPETFVVVSCKLVRVKYKPLKNCLAVYDFTVEHILTGEKRHFYITCRTYELQGSRRRFDRAVRQHDRNPSDFSAIFHVPELEMIGWVFPCESKLLSLPFISHAHYLKHVVLPRLIESLCGKDWQIVKFSSTVIHYVPEHTCTIRAELSLTRQGQKLTKTVFGKCYYNEAGEQTFSIMRKLHESSLNGITPLSFPAPLFYDAELKLLWQEGLSGQTLRDATAGVESRRELLPQAARAIALFHRIPVDHQLSVVKITDMLTTLVNRMEVLSHVTPLDRRKLNRVILTLQRTVPILAPTEIVTLHGDVHPQNLFLQNQSVAFIDLDSVIAGPAYHDVASWLCGMLYWGAMQHRSLQTLLPELGFFVTNYNQYAPFRVDEQDLSWFIAMALINERIFRCVTRFKSGRLQIINELLDWAEQFACGQQRIAI